MSFLFFVCIFFFFFFSTVVCTNREKGCGCARTCAYTGSVVECSKHHHCSSIHHVGSVDLDLVLVLVVIDINDFSSN